MDKHTKRADEVTKGNYGAAVGCGITALYGYLHLRLTVNCERRIFE